MTYILKCKFFSIHQSDSGLVLKKTLKTLIIIYSGLFLKNSDGFMLNFILKTLLK